MDYIVTTIEDKLVKENKNSFTQDNAEILIENEIALINFIWLLQAWHRAKLALWEARWEEEKIYNYVDCLEDIKVQIKNLWKKMVEYRKKLEENKE